jgi:hypothetical protein
MKSQFASPKARRIDISSLDMLKDDRLEMISTGLQMISILREAYEGRCSNKLNIKALIENYQA